MRQSLPRIYYLGYDGKRRSSDGLGSGQWQYSDK